MTHRELLAIVEFVKQHRHYLQGARFSIQTDHAPLRSVINAKDPEGQLARWIEFLSTFDFEIQYRAGQRHQNAMHFLADPAMTVVSGVGVGNLRNKCQLFMWVSRPR